jgi:hypothetical protein
VIKITAINEICRDFCLYNLDMCAEKVYSKTFQKAGEIFCRHNGLLRTSEALRLEISSATLYQMRDAGYIVGCIAWQK